VAVIKVAIDRVLPLSEIQDKLESIVGDLSHSTDLSDLYVVTKDGKPAAALVNLATLNQL